MSLLTSCAFDILLLRQQERKPKCLAPTDISPSPKAGFQFLNPNHFSSISRALIAWQSLQSGLPPVPDLRLINTIRNTA